jgi:sporulation protein YlmC with PRC-barrel domain
MRFTKDIRNTIIVDDKGNKIGVVKDLVANIDSIFPRITHIKAEINNAQNIGDVELMEPVNNIMVLIPWEQIGSFKDYKDKKINLVVSLNDVKTKSLESHELLLGENILDQQILNSKGIGLRRVDDVVLIEENGKLVLAGLCVGLSGILNQLGFEWPVGIINKLVSSSEIEQDIIPWSSVSEFKPKKQQIKLKHKDSEDSVVKITVHDEDDDAKKMIHKRTK